MAQCVGISEVAVVDDYPTRRAFPLAMQVSGEDGIADVQRLKAQGLAIEIGDFIPVEIWQGEYQSLAAQGVRVLYGFSGGKCLHGAFVDLHPGAQEPKLVALTRKRHRRPSKSLRRLAAT